MANIERQRLKRIFPNLKRRVFIYQVIRDFFNEQGFLEIETPVRAPHVIPEKEIIPISSEDWYLSTSPELYMKRLLAAGYDKIYQFARCFRKGEQGKLHNSEFTLLEWYRNYADYEQMMKDTEQLILRITREIGAVKAINYSNKEIDISLPWEKITVSEAYRKWAGWDPVKIWNERRFNEDMVLKIIPNLDKQKPVFLIDYPAKMASLARLKKNNPLIAERFELFIGGLELANAFSELVDRKEQEKRFQVEIREIMREQERIAEIPERFLEAVSNMNESAGIALGIDRLIMLFCNANSIDDVITFTVTDA